MKPTCWISALTALLALAALPAPALAVGVDEPRYIVVCEPGGTGGCTNPSNIYLQKFETEYIGNVLPHEWSCSWNATSVKSGAVAVRTYGWWRVNHPRSSSYDIYGNSNDQNFVPNSHNSTCDLRIDATAGVRVEYGSSPIFAAYRDETGNPTKAGGRAYMVPVSDPHTTLSSSGPGLCQHGSKDYGANGYSFTYILSHYYTGVTVATGANYFLSAAYQCTLNGRVRIETWIDTSNGAQFTRTYAAGPCPI